MTEILKEAKRIYDMGGGIHWIQRNSKAPVKAGWSSPVRDNWEQLKKEFQPGYGLGVRLGQASKIGQGFLANIDIDVKSKEERHRLEALQFVRTQFPEAAGAPVVQTGYGMRIFALTKTPLSSKKLMTSPDQTRVFMPSTQANRRQHQAVGKGLLSAADLRTGWRVRPAWEVEFMSAGKQVVLPPSIHPDTHTPYRWQRELGRPEDLPVLELAEVEVGSRQAEHGLAVVGDFQPVVVDYMDPRFSERVVGMILNGDGVENDDDSAAMLSVALSMAKARFTPDEILTVLTDRDTYLGDCPYRHRDTNSRAAAAAWAREYTLKKALAETDAATVFDCAVDIAVLGEEEAKAQTVELVKESWEEKLKRKGGKPENAPLPSLENTMVVLRGAIGLEVFRHNIFAAHSVYGVDAPWIEGKRGKPVDDGDIVTIKEWLVTKFRLEPPVSVILEAVTAIGKHNPFHPVREELEALPTWDATSRLATWLKQHFAATGPDEYLAQVFTKWLVASVARTYEPGRKFDWMPIFEGIQGVGKSVFGSILFGQPYFTDWMPKNLGDRDAALAIQGQRCAEFSELNSLSYSDIETVKGFLTRQVDKVRPLFGKLFVEYPRQTVFFGSTNKDHYLKDETGNRRFNPIKIGALDRKALERDRDQLWAEALFLYQNDLEESLYLEGEAKDAAEVIRQTRMVGSDAELMAEVICADIERQKSGKVDNAFDYFSRFQIKDMFEDFSTFQNSWKFNPRTAVSAVQALRIAANELGFEVNRLKSDGFWRYCFEHKR